MNRLWLREAFWGIEAGVLGAMAMLLFMTIVSLLERNPWWAYPNLLSTMFYGVQPLQSGPGWATVAGVAFQVLTAGVAGFLFGGLVVPVHGSARVTMIGILWGLAWFYLTSWFYRGFARLIPLYAPEFPLLAAHVMFGLILGRAGKTRRASESNRAIG